MEDVTFSNSRIADMVLDEMKRARSRPSSQLGTRGALRPSYDGEAEEGVPTPVPERTPTALDEAVAMLSQLAATDAPGDVQLAAVARALRFASAERRTSSPRVASVALVLSDALAFTPSSELTAAARASLKAGARALMEPFVSIDEEERVFSSLIEAGWEVTAFFNPQAYAAITEDQEI